MPLPRSTTTERRKDAIEQHSLVSSSLPFRSFFVIPVYCPPSENLIRPMLKNTLILGPFSTAVSLLPVSRRGLLISRRRFISTTPVNMAPPKPAQDFLDFVNASPTRKSGP